MGPLCAARVLAIVLTAPTGAEPTDALLLWVDSLPDRASVGSVSLSQVTGEEDGQSWARRAGNQYETPCRES
jgi:hypothetical protein